MRHRRKVTKLSRTDSHRKALLRNLATQLFTHERIKTTETRAKAVRPFAERLITIAKEDTVHARRSVSKVIHDKDVVKKLFGELSPRFKDRPGGYTRIMKLGHRQGDDAKMSIIELVEKELSPKRSAKTKDAGTPKAVKEKAAAEEKKGKSHKSAREEKRKEKRKEE
jgi:large subunit ribosomal protein L17